MIQSMNGNVMPGVNNYKKNGASKPENVENTQPQPDKNDGSGKKTDSYVKSSVEEKSLDSLTYSKPKKDYTDEVNALKESHAKQVAEFKQKILSMVTKQGEKSNASLFGLNLNVNNDQIAAAKQSISADGEWGVNAVATRIMDMAHALSGGDDSKLQTLKDAVIKGFKAAGFNPDNKKGSGMPEITGQTYDEVMKRFDEWENGKKKED